MRKCPMCKRNLPSSYYMNSLYCFQCHRMPRRYLPSSFTASSHGITLKDYFYILKEQNFECAICGIDVYGYGKPLFIDHDHKCCPGSTSCGECIRGLLCNRCNVGIGMFQDNEDALLQASLYLSK